MCGCLSTRRNCISRRIFCTMSSDIIFLRLRILTPTLIPVGSCVATGGVRVPPPSGQRGVSAHGPGKRSARGVRLTLPKEPTPSVSPSTYGPILRRPATAMSTLAGAPPGRGAVRSLFPFAATLMMS
jgi:hypothetical protein